MRSSSLFMWTVALASATFAGCGSSDRPTVPFTVWVFDQRLTIDGEDKPIVGARVAFDPAGGGSRTTLTTEADGHVTFDADFAEGPASVTVLSDDHAFTTMLEASPDSARARPNALGKPASDLVIIPLRLDDVAESLTVEVRGNIFGWKSPTNEVTLAASALSRLGAVTALEPRYALRAPRGRPFFVLGSALTSFLDPAGNVVSNDVVSSFRIDLAGRTEDERLDIDLATVVPLATQPLHLRAELLQGSEAAFGPGSRAYATVISADSALTLGVFSRATRAPDGRAFDLDLTVTSTDITPERPLTQVTLVAPDGSRSARTEQGIAPDGASWTDFAPPPTLRDPDATRTAHDAIPLDRFPPGADLMVRVLAGGKLFWVLHGPPGGLRNTSFTIPYRDEVAATDVQVFAVSVSASSDRVELPGYGSFYRHSSSSRDIVVSKR